MFSVATNFDPEILEYLDSAKIYEVYGKKNFDLIGGAKPGIVLPQISDKKLKNYIRSVHKKNISFNYLLNTVSLNNMEYTAWGRYKIFKFLDKLNSYEVDALTVANPYLAEVVKKKFPKLKLDVSVVAEVDNLQKVKQWEDLGAEVITLSPDINRDFKTLEKIRKNTKVKVKLMVNSGCAYNCVYKNYHFSVVAISSKTGVSNINNTIDSIASDCRERFAKDWSNFLKAPWIRPEDIQIYRDLGIDYFKLISRSDPTPRLIKIIQAYLAGHFSGNILEIVDFRTDKYSLNFRTAILILFNLFKNQNLNIKKLFNSYKKYYQKDFNLYIDNNLLQGFIDKFFKSKNSCRNLDCANCNYCHEYAQRTIRKIK